MASPVAEVATKLEARAAAFVKEQRLPGVAAGVVHGDDLVWSTGAGFADVAAARPPDAGTLYRIASITKTFTATALLQLRDEGRLHLDDPAVAYLPELRAAQSPFGAIETVTLRRMLSHESGLMGDPPDTDWSGPRYEGDPASNLARIAQVGTKVPPNTQQKYSNLAFQLLGEVIARVSGMSYAAYLRAHVLDPLELASTAFEPLPDALGDRRAVGYAPRAFSDDFVVSVTPPSVQAEGGLWSCVADLARWLSFQFREQGGARGGAQILSGETLREMHRPRYLGDEAWTEAWCIGWYAQRKDDVIWVQHSGGLHGFITNVCFDPKERVGAIALVNGLGDASTLAVELGSIARTAVREAAPTIAPPVPLPEAYRSLLGLYADPEYGTVARLEWRDGALTFVDPDQPEWRPTLAPSGTPDVFVVEPGVRESGEPCVFDRRADGRVRSVLLGPMTFARLDPVEG
ncbi:MAG: serine hydrolase domain-containing protein [Planctomycetaceae bacterium]